MSYQYREEVLNALRDALATAGYDPDNQHFQDTPSRWLRVITEEFRMPTEPPDLKAEFADDYKGLVLERGIEFSSLCAHHLMPFIGTASVGYLPDGKVLGISKLARLVEYVTHRITIQETATHEILQGLVERLKPRGCIVVLEATHGCMTARGIRRPHTSLVTADMTGLFLENAHGCRDEFYELLRGTR